MPSRSATANGHVQDDWSNTLEADLETILPQLEDSGMRIDPNGLVTDWADRPGQDAKPVFLTDERRRKIDFNAKEELLLLTWCTTAELECGSGGSAIFQQLECLYPHHSWQAYEGKWRRGGLSKRPAPTITTDSPFPNLIPAGERYQHDLHFHVTEAGQGTLDPISLPLARSNSSDAVDGPEIDSTQATRINTLKGVREDSDESDMELTYSDFRVDVMRNVYLQLNVPDKEELWELLSLDWIVTPFVEFAQASLVPLRSEDLDSISRQRSLPRRSGRGQHQWKIQQAINSTSSSESRYLQPHPDKSFWTHDDHELRFMAQIAREASNRTGHAWNLDGQQSVDTICGRSFWLMFWMRWVYRPTNATSEVTKRVQRQKNGWLGFLSSLYTPPTQEVDLTTSALEVDYATSHTVRDADHEVNPTLDFDTVWGWNSEWDDFFSDSGNLPSAPSPAITLEGGVSSPRNGLEIMPAFPEPAVEFSVDAVTAPTSAIEASSRQPEHQTLQTDSDMTTTDFSAGLDIEKTLGVAAASQPQPVTPQATTQISVPDYKPNQSRTKNQERGISWLTEEYYLVFKNVQDVLLSRWGVTASHQDTCVLIDRDWVDISPEELEQSFQWDQLLEEETNRLRCHMGDLAVSHARASVWFSSWPDRPRRGVDLDVLLVHTPNDVYPAWQASHLCGHGKCIVPTHLTAESQTMNLSRMACTESAKEFRIYSFPIPRYCNKHEPPCLLQDMALTSKEKLAIQFWTYRRARGLPAREFSRPASHPMSYATFEQNLPTSIGTDVYSLSLDHLKSDPISVNQSLGQYRIQCCFCLGVQRRWNHITAFWSHVKNLHELVPREDRLAEIRRSAVDYQAWMAVRAADYERHNPETWIKLQQAQAENFTWEVVQGWRLRADRAYERVAAEWRSAMNYSS